MIYRLLLALVLAVLASSNVAVAAAEPPSGGRPIVIGQSYILHSKILGDDRRINIYLPEHYADPKRSFPALYLLDGGEQEDFLHIAGLAQINAAYGFGQEVIVIGVEGVDRKHDLTSPSAVASDLKRVPTAGGAALYRRFLVEELKPWVALHYRSNGRSGLIGESLAGLFTLETLLTAPSSFDDYIAVSPSLWWNGGALSDQAAADLKAGDFTGKRAFVAFDDPPPPADRAARDRAQQTRVEAAFNEVRPKGLEFSVIRPGEGHGSIYHPAALKAFRALYPPPH